MSLSIITSILSNFDFVPRSLDFSNLVIKSSDINTHGFSGIGSGCSFPYGLCFDSLLLLQILQF